MKKLEVVLRVINVDETVRCTCCNETVVAEVSRTMKPVWTVDTDPHVVLGNISAEEVVDEVRKFVATELRNQVPFEEMILELESHFKAPKVP